MPKTKAYKWLEYKWDDLIEVEIEKSVTIEPYNHGVKEGLHAGYITTPKKRKNDMVLLSEAKGVRTYGFINKQNAPIKSPTKVLIDADRMNRLRIALEDDVLRQSKEYGTEPNTEQIHKVSFDECGLHVFGKEDELKDLLSDVLDMGDEDSDKD